MKHSSWKNWTINLDKRIWSEKCNGVNEERKNIDINSNDSNNRKMKDLGKRSRKIKIY